MRELPNLVFLEVDTSGLYEDAEVIHVLVLDAGGDVLLRAYAPPVRPLSPALERITGISNDLLVQQGQSVKELLTQVRQTLTGKYVLSYNLDFDVIKLQEAAKRASVEPLPIIGDDLMQRAMHYFGLTTYPKLEALCQRIGQPLPAQPQQQALDRARGQRALLLAMAAASMGSGNETTTLPVVDDDDDLDDLDDEHPF